MAVLKGGTYAKKGEETSHRNPKVGHMQKKARKPPTEIRKQDICKKRRGNLPQKSESRTYAKKGEETSHRNPETGHNQKENLHMSQQKENVGHSQKKICICPNKRKMWDIVERKSSIPHTSYLSLPEIKFE